MTDNVQGENQIPYVDESCIGCGLCANIAEHTFQMVDTDNGPKSIVTNTHGNETKKIQEAIDICPVTAIHWQNIAEAIKKDLRN